MEWLRSLGLGTGKRTHLWGYNFEWTADHLTPEQYLPLKFSYDKLADECLEILNQIAPPDTSSKNEGGNVLPRLSNEPGSSSSSSSSTSSSSKPSSYRSPKRDLFVLLRDHRTEHAKLQQLWDEVTAVPEWVDWDQIARGQEIFYRYGGATLTGLAFQSLVGGMGADKIVETLSRTGGFNVKVARSRLFETTQHILQCTQSLSSIQSPEGAGFISSVRVRLLHASVRQRILKLVQTHPTYYSVEKNGIPINDIDCVATICSFSPTILFHALPAQGIFPRRQEIEDYTALWRLIAHYTGTPTHFFATPAKSKAIMESLLAEISPSPTSVVLANNVLRSLENTPPAYASYNFLCVQTRWLNGPALSDRLGIPVPPFHYYILMAGQCLFFMALCYSYRAVPALDRRKITTLRRVFWNVIVESKEYGLGGMTEFGLKHVPEMGKGTEKGESWEKHDKKMWEGLERRSMRTLGVAGVVVGVGMWTSWKIGGWLVSRLF